MPFYSQMWMICKAKRLVVQHSFFLILFVFSVFAHMWDFNPDILMGSCQRTISLNSKSSSFPVGLMYCQTLCYLHLSAAFCSVWTVLGSHQNLLQIQKPASFTCRFPRRLQTFFFSNQNYTFIRPLPPASHSTLFMHSLHISESLFIELYQGFYPFS